MPNLKNLKAKNLAIFIYDNYDKITGYKLETRDEEQDFPQIILDIIEANHVDFEKFQYEYCAYAETL